MDLELFDQMIRHNALNMEDFHKIIKYVFAKCEQLQSPGRDKETNERYWELINAFKDITGYGLVINTSFNVRGEPIVCSPYDAFRCFMSTEMDYLVINNFVYKKTDQIDWENKDKWMVKFRKD